VHVQRIQAKGEASLRDAHRYSRGMKTARCRSALPLVAPAVRGKSRDARCGARDLRVERVEA
jgi:hypothetical protein